MRKVIFSNLEVRMKPWTLIHIVSLGRRITLQKDKIRKGNPKGECVS